MEVANRSALPNLEVRLVSCNESAIKRWLSSELEETVFSLTHELFMTKHHTVTLMYNSVFVVQKKYRRNILIHTSWNMAMSFHSQAPKLYFHSHAARENTAVFAREKTSHIPL